MKGEIALSAGVIALGALAAAVTALLPSEGGYAGVGPNFVPALVSAALIALGASLLRESLSGGWRKAPPRIQPFRLPPFLWVSGGLVAHMALIGTAGFVAAAAVLFACVARGFGSRRVVRDVLLGLALAAAVFVFFTEALNVSLPAGWMPSTR